MRMMDKLLLITAIAASAAGPDIAHAQRTGLEDMVGARAGQAEGELQRRGYRNVRGEQGDDRSYTYWWNAERRRCVTIATMNGRYDSITPTTAPDCRQSASIDRPRPPRPSRERPDRRPDLAFGDPSRTCRGEAADRFDRRPSEITVNAPIAQRNGTIVQGWFDGDRGTTFFTCRFDADGRFTSVR